MRTQKFDCIGRVPASISDLDKCDICLNESLCMSMQGGVSQADVQKAEEKYGMSDSSGRDQQDYLLK